MTAQPSLQPYSRENPSPRYRELLALYKVMHEEGDTTADIPPESTFPGQSLIPLAGHARNMIQQKGAKTILDYGAGKGQQYGEINLKNKQTGEVWPDMKTYWGVDAIHCYDPAYAPFTTLPEGTFDGVICTDVLEHCPEEDIPWIIGELFGYATKFVFANAACYPAKKTLPNGENAHCTIQPAEWWAGLIRGIAQHHPGVSFLFIITVLDDTPEGTKFRRIGLTSEY